MSVICSFDGKMELEPMNSYSRLLIHRLAHIFGYCPEHLCHLISIFLQFEYLFHIIFSVLGPDFLIIQLVKEMIDTWFWNVAQRHQCTHLETIICLPIKFLRLLLICHGIELQTIHPRQ